MAILKSFLCICNTRTGSLICGCYTLVISLLCLVYYLFRYVGHKLIEDSTEYKGIIYVGFVLYGFMIVASLIVIPGVQLDKRYLLLPWIYIVILVVLYDTGSVALLTTVHMEKEKTLHVWEIVWVFVYCFRLAANCYCFTCMVSQYQELSDGRGTYDYLYKRHRRTRCPRAHEFDIDTFDLPFGVHLPPYREEDDTENNPPTYEKIYPQIHAQPAENSSQSAENTPNTDNNQQQNSENSENSGTTYLSNYLNHVTNHVTNVTNHVFECTNNRADSQHRTNHESNCCRQINQNCYQVTVDIGWI